jgi:hypothetical protein
VQRGKCEQQQAAKDCRAQRCRRSHDAYLCGGCILYGAAHHTLCYLVAARGTRIALEPGRLESVTLSQDGAARFLHGMRQRCSSRLDICHGKSPVFCDCQVLDNVLSS